MTIEERFEFRSIKPDELEQAIAIESICFPPNEACAPEKMKDRVENLSDFFLVAVDRESGKLAGFLNGMATNETTFRDEFFTDVTLHDPNGTTVMLFGLDVLPAYRRQGLATKLMSRYAQREKKRGGKQMILTCLDEKVEMYQKMGYQDLGTSGSVWGGEVWHDMILRI